MTAQFLWILGARLTANLLQAINIILLARAVSPSDIGLTSAIIGFCMVLFTVTEFGFATLIIKSCARGDHAMAASALRYTTLSTWTFGSIGFVAGLGLSAGGIIPLSLTTLILAVAIDRCVEYRLGVPIAANSKVIPSTSILIRRGTQIVVFLAFMGVGLPALWAYSLAQLLGALVGYLQSTFFLSRMVVRVSSHRPVKEVLGKALAYYVNGVTGVIQTLDSFLVSVFSGAHSAGLYAAASRATSPLILIPGTLAESMLPHATRATPQQARKFGVRLVLMLLVVLVLGAPIGFIIAEPLCTLLYGEAYRGAGLPLAVLFLGIPFAILAAAVSAILQAQGDAKFVAKVGMARALSFVAAVAIGSIMYGAIGAAIGSSIAVSVICLPLILRVLRIHELPRRGTTSDTDNMVSP